MKKTKLLMIALMASLLALGSGCVLFVAGALVAGGVAGYSYVNGELKVTAGATVNQAYDASLSAMSDLQFTVTSKTKDALQGEIDARNSSNTAIVIKLKYMSNTATEIRIRVGTFGDKTMSDMILDKIKSHLPTSGS